MPGISDFTQAASYEYPVPGRGVHPEQKLRGPPAEAYHHPRPKITPLNRTTTFWKDRKAGSLLLTMDVFRSPEVASLFLVSTPHPTPLANV